MYTQKIPGLGQGRQTFEFDDEHLIWRRHLDQEDDRELKFAWKDIPAEFYFRDVDSASKAAQRQVGLIAMIAVTFVAVMRNDATAIWITLAISAAVIATFVVTSRVLSVRRTEIPTRPPISVYRDQFHDEIIGELTKRRRGYFSNMAYISLEETARSNLRRFDWLRRIRAITSEEYLAFERELVPANCLSDRPSQTLPARYFHQEWGLSSVDFEMKADHFTYQRRLLGWGRWKFNFEYTEIGRPKEIYRNSAFSTAFAFAVYMASALGVIALDLWLNAGPTHGVQATVMGLGGLLLLAMVTALLCICPVHVIAQGLYALDEKSDGAADILSELEVRRRTARKEQVMQSSIFLTKNERETRLAALRRDDVISESELHEMVAMTENVDEIWLDQTPVGQGGSAKPVLH